MSIILSNSNIIVDYKTSSFNVETVKTELNVRNTIYDNYYDTVANSINAAPSIKPYIYKEDDKIYVVETYQYQGVGNQTTYTRTFAQNTLCDILVVGGGGAGGNDRGGGGGGGGVIFSQNITLNGTYTVTVGKEGIGSTSGTTGGSGTRGTNGSDSSISGTGLTTLTAVGGGAGASCASGLRDGLSGGSGGGGSQILGAGSGGSGTAGQGKNGGIGFEWGAGGGGGGYTAVGTNASSTNAGNGGIGLPNSITGTTIIYGSGGGGGGSGGTGSGTGNQLAGTGGSIGAGNGTIQNVNAHNATINGCGGGGAGHSNGVTTKGGNGGSGIVIIRYIIETLPKIFTGADGITYVIETYQYRGSGNQTSYTKTFSQNTLCDILLVAGGGGGGGRNAGGGGAGGLVLVQNISLSGSFTINVGNGGIGRVSDNSGLQGYNTTITKSDNSIIITANGGGSGGATAGTGGNGGSGGGGGYVNGGGSQTQKSQSQIGISSPATLNQFGENGGHGGGGSVSYPGGGGGGAGGVGRMNSAENETGQNGGLGIDRVGTFIFNKTFSSSIGDNGWFAGGGGSAGGFMNTNYAYGNGGAALFGGGGNGDGIGRGINGINGTGGGGGGIRYSDTIPGGNGGSGIVLIRYKLDPSATNNKLLTMEPVVTSLVTPQRTPYIYTFKHKRGANTQEPYTISFDEDTLCDILIVGGGGSSGRTDGIVSQEPGGGGGGGIVYMVNKTLKGTYNIIVGKGGENSNGYDSEIRDINNNIVNFDSINLVGKGGGKGGIGGTGGGGSNGGSGGGGGHVTATGAATQGNTFWDGTQYVQGGFNGSVGNPAGFAGNNGGGGGGASATALGCEGGHGRIVTITGFNQFYGGGGGAGGGAGGRAGGLGGGGSGRIGGYGDGVKGTNDLGGGGGAAYSSTTGIWHPGGSGIVIIKVHQKIINKNIITFRHSELNESRTAHEFTFTKNTICDILVVGGGGGGGGAGGSGGGGGVVSLNDVSFPSGVYNILVGYGGMWAFNNNGAVGSNGNNSSIEGNGIIIRAAGGGGGGQYNANSAPTPPSVTYTNPLTNTIVTSQGGGGGVRFNSIPYSMNTSLSGMGGINTDNNAQTGGAGGGAAPASLGGTGGNSYLSGGIGYLGNGGRGIVSSISGIPIEYGSGGAGSQWNSGFATTIFGIATGGGGYAEIKDINNKTYFWNVYNGIPGTGGGGYSTSYGGSGIVILKIKSIIEAFYYTPVIKSLNNLINSTGYPYIPADTTNLIAWYKFDGNANDSNPTATKHNFSTISGTISYGKDAIINKPYLNLFNGTLSNSTLKFDRRAFTISYLVRLYNYEGLYYIYTTGATTSNNTLHIGSRVNGAYMLGFMNNDIETDRNYNEDVNNWILFTATVDNNYNRKMYRNGILFKTDSNTSALTATGNLELRLNRVDICDMRVYDRALTPDEIALLYNGYIVNSFNINFPSTTIASVNAREEVQFKGSYDITLSSTTSSIIPKENQTILKNPIFVTFTNEREYPPATARTFTQNATLISGQSYGNGLYILSASSQYSSTTIDYGPYKMFGSTGEWTTETAMYAPSTGNYGGTFSFNGYNGEWIKIQLPVKIKLTKYKIESTSGLINRAPSIYKIFGSDDNINWVEIVNRSQPLSVSNYGGSYAYEETVSGKEDYYNYFCLVVNRTLGNSDKYLSIFKLYIYGREYIGNSIDIRCQLLNNIKDPIGAQWTYNKNNTNVYHLGNVGIGTKNPEYALDIEGNIFSSLGGYTLSTQTSWTTLSDRRIKNNITKASYETCLENVKNIELYRFNFKNDVVNTTDRNQLGFIAQEVQKVYPKAVEANQIYVSGDNRIDDLLSLDTTQIKYNLYGAFKYLLQKVELLEKKLNIYESSNVDAVSNNVITEDTFEETSNIANMNITSNFIVILDSAGNILITEDVSSNILITEDVSSNILITNDVSSNILITNDVSSNILITDEYNNSNLSNNANND